MLRRFVPVLERNTKNYQGGLNMGGKFITVKFKKGQAQKWANKVQNDNDVAISRALNTVSKSGVAFTSKEVAADSGLNIGQVKKEIKVTKATRRKHFFLWLITGKRLPWAKPRKIVGGASFLTDANTRDKIKKPLEGGNRLFTAKSRKTKAKVAAFRPKGSKKAWHLLSGHSLPYWIRDEWYKRVLRLMTDRLSVEYKKEVKKARFGKL